MKFCLDWIRDYLDTDVTIDEIINKLTYLGLEVEDFNARKDLENFVVAEILEAKSHPNANKLQICRVFDGKEEFQIVCGAHNARTGIKVVLAKNGVIIPKNNLKIEKISIRGIESNGMLCSASELLLGEDSDGIIELSDHYHVGTKYIQTLIEHLLIEIKLTPNRGDCTGVIGIARDLSAAGLGKFKNPKNNIKKLENFGEDFNIKITSNGCNKIFFVLIEEVKNISTPEFIKKRLSLAGTKPKNFLVDLTNYLQFDLGSPMHAYDADKISTQIIEIRNSVPGETFVSLKDEVINISKDSILITSGKQILGLAGIMGGKDSAVDENTKRVLIEVGHFDPIQISLSGQRSKINSDSRFRFERGVDYEIGDVTLEKSLEMISEIAGGKCKFIKKTYKTQQEVKAITFTTEDIKKVLGIEMNIDQYVEILQKLGFEIKIIDDQIKAIIPSHRFYDINCINDIAEEIARIIGYDKIGDIPLYARRDKIFMHNDYIEKVRTTALSMGLNEVMNFPFINQNDLDLFDLKCEKLINPINENEPFLRSSLLPSLLKVLNYNLAQKNNIFNGIFEISKIFLSCDPKDQLNCISGLRIIEKKKRFMNETIHDVGSVKKDLINLIKAVVNNFDECHLQIIKSTKSYLHPGLSFDVSINNKNVGSFGAIHPKICSQYDIDEKILFFEFITDHCLDLQFEKKHYKKTNFPSISRELSFLVDENVEVSKILQSAKEAHENVEEVFLLDIYKDNESEQSSLKAVTISISISQYQKTMINDEILEIYNAVIQNVESITNGKLRQPKS